MDVYVDQQKYRLDAAKSIGKGGEADIFAFGNNQAIKIFNPPSASKSYVVQIVRDILKAR